MLLKVCTRLISLVFREKKSAHDCEDLFVAFLRMSSSWYLCLSISSGSYYRGADIFVRFRSAVFVRSRADVFVRSASAYTRFGLRFNS